MAKRKRVKRKKQSKFKPGDAVVVKPNVDDPDLGANIGGWQGRISEPIEEDDDVVCIAWDSVTLKQMPDEMIVQCEEKGLGWTEMRLYPHEVEPTNPRDNEDDVDNIIDRLEDKHAWSHLGEEGRRIQAVVANAKSRSEWAEYEAWEAHFRKILKFPFKAEVSEWQERSPLRTGDRVKVLGIDESVDLYGVLVAIQHRRRKLVFPLCDLEVSAKSSPNYRPVKDYAVWFANR